VFYGHSQILQVETKEPVTPAVARAPLKAEASIKLARSSDNVVSAVDSSGGNDVVHIGRIAQPTGATRRLTLWSVADNMRKGAAVNIVEIAETLLKNHL
jgi:aspartate-semialdehyde dehydrogenase